MMLQELRDYWLPLMLFVGAIVIAIALLTIATALPLVIDDLPTEHPLLKTFAEDATVQRTSIVGAIGLIVTACVFFRPSRSVLSRTASKKPANDTMAGA